MVSKEQCLKDPALLLKKGVSGWELANEQIEGNYLYEKNISWRVNDKNVSMSFDEKFIVALMHLTGNVLIPNWLTKFLYISSDRLPLRLKKQLITFLLSDRYYSFAMRINTVPGLIHDKGFYFVVKKMFDKLRNKHKQ